MGKIKIVLQYMKQVQHAMKSVKGQGRKVYLFGTPLHSNMGDNAQTMCAIKWINRNYPDTKVYDFDTVSCIRFDQLLLRKIAKKIRPEDMIFLHSGYHTTDLYMNEENMQRSCVKLFPNNKIVILPQTILYKKDEEKQKAIQIYNSHKNLSFLCRDDVSYQTAQEIFGNCQLLKFPDIVTTLIGTKEFHNDRNGILMCLRNDKESFYGKEKLAPIMKKLEQYGEVAVTDTTIDMPIDKIQKHREGIIDDILNEYSKYKLIITDRYHGTIFSLIANTPVLVLSSTDHKLESGVKWFPEEFSDYVKYIKNVEDLEEEVERVMKTNYNYSLPPYFNTEYYDKLKEKLEK